MDTSSSNLHALAIAQLTIYTSLSFPTLYILYKHSLCGLLANIYIFIFCLLRIIGSALFLSNGTGNETAALLSSIGLSPLILGIAGLLHEGRHYRIPKLDKKVELISVLLFHILVTTGLALLASGSSAFETSSTSNDGDSKESLIKIGICILLTSWVILCLFSVFSLISSSRSARDRQTTTYVYGTKLLYTTLLTLPFLGVRVLYSAIAILAPSKDLNVVSPAFGLRVGLSFLPELIVVILVLGVGLVTRDVRTSQKLDKDVKVVSGGRLEEEGGLMMDGRKGGS